MIYNFTLTARGFAFFGFYMFCPGKDAYFESAWLLGLVTDWMPLVWYGGVPAVVVAFLAHWILTRLGRPLIGRVCSRVLAASLLVLYGIGPLGFIVDMAIDRGCLETWGGPDGVVFFLGPVVAPFVAALCVLAAVRTPKHRVRRFLIRVLRSRGFRRGLAAAAALGVLAILPAGDLMAGVITPASRCPSEGGSPIWDRAGSRAFLCGVRSTGGFADISDRDLLAYGRAMCEAYPRRDISPHEIAPICPRAAVDVKARYEAEEAEYEAQEAANQKVCDTSRHRPLVRPVRVARERTWTDYGVLESFESEDAIDDPLLSVAQRNGLVASLPGHLMILSHSDFDICLTAETYRKRPPVEVKGWDHVVEVGYESPTGQIELMDPMAGESDLPNLAFRGKGHYRVRVHYRLPDSKGWTPQHLLVMVYPGKGDQVVEHRRRP